MTSPAAPARYTLLFDGRCGMCSAWRVWIARHDRGDRITLLPYQDPAARDLVPDLPPERFAGEMQLILADGRVVGGATAIAESLRVLPGYRWLGALLRLPPILWMARRVYAVIARNRRRISQRFCLAPALPDEPSSRSPSSGESRAPH